MLHDVANAFVRMLGSLAIDAFSEAEFPANRNLAFGFGLIGQQARSHLTGVDEHEWRIEERSGITDLCELVRIGHGMKRSAKCESAFAATGMQVDDDAHPRKDAETSRSSRSCKRWFRGDCLEKPGSYLRCRTARLADWRRRRFGSIAASE